MTGTGIVQYFRGAITWVGYLYGCTRVLVMVEKLLDPGLVVCAKYSTCR